MQLGLSQDEIAGMLVGAGDRMIRHFDEISSKRDDTDELGNLFSSMMVTVSASVMDIVLENNKKIVSDLQDLGLLK